jgi:diadenosine tetraphosphate (Ap4A) HIT family hydrolase
MKRWFYFFLLLFFIFAVYEWGSGLIDAVHLNDVRARWDQPSAFTEKKILDRQVVFEGKEVLVLLNYKPLLRGHLLIIPKRQAARVEDLTAEEWVEMKSIISLFQKVFKNAYGASDYVLVVQNGIYAGQTVPHMHFHMIPRDDSSVVATKAKIWNSFFTESLGLRQPLSAQDMLDEIKYLQPYIETAHGP